MSRNRYLLSKCTSTAARFIIDCLKGHLKDRSQQRRVQERTSNRRQTESSGTGARRSVRDGDLFSAVSHCTSYPHNMFTRLCVTRARVQGKWSASLQSGLCTRG